MTSILVSLDKATCRALNRVAPAAKRQRSEFIRRAIQRAVQQAEFARMRRAYLEQPDTEPEGEDWSTWEGFHRRTSTSVTNCDNLRMVSKARLLKKVGALRRERHIAVKRSVGYAFAWEELMNLA